MTPGDVIGYQGTAGLLETVTAAANDEDLVATAPGLKVAGDTLTEGTDANVLPGHRNLLRAVVSQPSVVQLYHTFVTDGNFSVSARVSNEQLPDFEVNNFTVVILEGIDFIIIKAPEHASLNKPVLFEILPHMGGYNHRISNQ